MGDIRVDNRCEQNTGKYESVDVLSTAQVDGDSFQSFEAAGIIAGHVTTPTGMRDEILLLSWLIVLLRTREGGDISFDWAYKSLTNGPEQETVNRSLSMDEVVTGLQSNVEEISAAISRHIATEATNQTSSPVSLLVSTGSLSPTSEESKDEVSE